MAGLDVAALLEQARQRNWRIATAESCTGGMIAAALTDIPGSSDVVDCGFVTYSNGAKVAQLGVLPHTLTAFGAVSEEVAHQMAVGAVQRSGVDLAVSVTGIAGPGGSEFKPEGRVCFGVATPDTVRTETVEFGALGRTGVRKAATEHALRLLADALT